MFRLSENEGLAFCPGGPPILHEPVVVGSPGLLLDHTKHAKTITAWSAGEEQFILLAVVRGSSPELQGPQTRQSDSFSGGVLQRP